MTETHNIKTVPVYYEDDIIGSAEIKTMKYVSIKDSARYVDAWSINDIKINKNFKWMFLHLWIYHYRDVEINTIISRSKYEGVAVAVGHPNMELLTDKDNMRYPCRPELKDISFEDVG